MEHTISERVHDLFAVLAISQLLFMCGACLLSHHQPLSRKLLILYCASVAAYLLTRISLFDHMPLLWSLPFYILAATIPILFWLLAHRLFNDTEDIPRFIIVMLSLYLTLRIVDLLVLSQELMTMDPWTHQRYTHARRIFALSIVTHACVMAIQGYSADLVADRRRLRSVFVLTMGGITLMITGSSLFGITHATATSIYFLAIFLVTFMFNIHMFRLKNDFTETTRPIVRKDPQSHLSEAERICYQKILDALNRDRLYAQPGLTLTRLAAALNMKEYRLREFINKKLHYRNFNQFINDYRLTLAIDKLEDRDDGKTLVSTIAWDLGYSSPSSFNKVFKDKFGCAPSEYRKRLYDSPASRLSAGESL